MFLIIFKLPNYEKIEKEANKHNGYLINCIKRSRQIHINRNGIGEKRKEFLLKAVVRLRKARNNHEKADNDSIDGYAGCFAFGVALLG